MDITIPETAVDIYRSLPEGTRCEVLYNQLSMTPAPNTKHQLLSIKISALLYNYLEESNKGVVFNAPTDVYFEDKRSVIQPDVFVIMNEHKSIIRDEGVYGVPDIIFEILSRNRVNDTFKKKTLYEEVGVKEYFIIDPADKTVVMYALNDEHKYEIIYEIIGKIASAILGFSFVI